MAIRPSGHQAIRPSCTSATILSRGLIVTCWKFLGNIRMCTNTFRRAIVQYLGQSLKCADNFDG